MKISNDIIRKRIRNLPSVNIYVTESSQMWNKQFSALYMTNQPTSFCRIFRYDSPSHIDRVCTSSGITFPSASRFLKPRVVRNACCIPGIGSGMLLVPVYNVPVDGTWIPHDLPLYQYCKSSTKYSPQHTPISHLWIAWTYSESLCCCAFKVTPIAVSETDRDSG